METDKLKSDILSFRQKGGEKLYQAWDSFKSMLMSCPHQHQSNEVLVHTFIKGLEANTKILLDQLQVVRLWKRLMLNFSPC